MSTKPALEKSEFENTNVRKITLYSALPAQVILAQLQGGLIASPSDKNELIKKWQEANAIYNTNGNPSRSFLMPDDLEKLDGSKVDQELISNVLKRAKLYSPYDSHPTEILNVNISKIVTPQLTVSLTRSRRRTSSNKQNFSAQELFTLAFEYQGPSQTLTRQILGMGPNSGSVLYTSYDEDVRIHHPPQYLKIPINSQDPESVQYDGIGFPVGGGLPFAAAMKVDMGQGRSRLIASNGIHRLYSLAKLGLESFPMLVVDISPMELPDQFVDVPKAILLDPNSNPPLITDFVDDQVTISLDYYKVLKTIRLNWSFEQYSTVLR